jgi:putative PIN family toxin of toxin-antitoxin system
LLDSVVFVRALINPRGLCGRIVLERAHEYDLIVSDEIVREVMEVTGRGVLRHQYHRLADLNLATIRESLSHAATINVTEVLPVSRDPSDDKFLAAAEAANADMLVTEDQDLLVIGEHAAVRIMNAMTFIRELNARTSESEPRT